MQGLDLSINMLSCRLFESVVLYRADHLGIGIVTLMALSGVWHEALQTYRKLVALIGP